MGEKFDNLEEHLEKFIENIRQLGIIVSDFQPSGQVVLNQKLNTMIGGLQEIEKCRQSLHDVHVPLEVFEYIDQGKNPQLYTKECLERALAKNEQVKGKIDAMKKFRSQLIAELSRVFPEEMNKYKAIRGEDGSATFFQPIASPSSHGPLRVRALTLARPSPPVPQRSGHTVEGRSGQQREQQHVLRRLNDLPGSGND
ncbi:unnamed protein product [Lampetra fluviatilis]